VTKWLLKTAAFVTELAFSQSTMTKTVLTTIALKSTRKLTQQKRSKRDVLNK